MLQPAHGRGIGFPYQHSTSRYCPRCTVRENVATTKRRKDRRVPLVEGRRYVERMLRWYDITRQSVKSCYQQFNGFHLVASPVGNGYGGAVALLSSLIFVELLRMKGYMLNISDIHSCLSSTNLYSGNVGVEYGREIFSFRCYSHRISVAKRRNSTLHRASVPPSSVTLPPVTSGQSQDGSPP